MESIIKFVLFCVIVLIIIFVLAAPFMWLWNWIAPIFWVGAPTLTFWQALGTLLLLQFLKPVSTTKE